MTHPYYEMKREPRTFRAKYPGRCVNCDEPIEVDDLLRWDDDRVAVHAACDAVSPALTAKQEVCPRCFTEKAVNGTCAGCS